MHRAGDVLDLLLAEIVERDIELVADFVAHDAADADAARFGETFEAGGEIDPVAENVAVLDDDVALVDADAEVDALVGRDAFVAFRHRALHLDRTAHRADDAGEFDQQPVAHRLDDAALMLLDPGVAEIAPDRAQGRERALLVPAHQKRIAGDIDRNDCRETALDPLHAHLLAHSLGCAYPISLSHDSDRFRPEGQAMDQHTLEWPQQGNARVPYRVFADPEIYRAELDRVFLGPTWQYLGLADELPEPGDYKTTFLGETPVIVTRGEDGEIHAMVNRCAHRGNLVCLKQRGHTKDGLTCVYHAWRYDLAGNLTSVAFRRGVGGKGGMPESFRLEEHGLKKLRTDQFAGLVFGTLSPEAPPLADYIGNLIGSRIGRVMRGKPKVLGTTSQILHNNWKLYIENVKDTYHASLLAHLLHDIPASRRLTTAGGVAIAESGAHHASYTDGEQGGDKRRLRPALCRNPLAARGLPAARTRAFSTRSTRSATASRCRSSASSRISSCSRSTTRSRCAWCCRRGRTRPNCNGPISGSRTTMRR